jgi:hypothetical protein
MAIQNIHSLDDGCSGGLVIMEEITTQKDEICILLGSYLKDLFESSEGVVLADVIVLPNALQKSIERLRLEIDTILV